jgi:AcrR family transcriptional regulator
MTVEPQPVKSDPEVVVVRRPMGKAAALDRDTVVDAAVALAAREGFGALSMRRVAADLGVGTMSLYWHVETREELIELMFDRAIAGQLLDVVPTDWREALAQIARATHAAFSANVWLKDVPFVKRMGVGIVEHVEQSIAAVENMDLPLAHRMAAVSLVDTFVRGWVLDHSLGPEGTTMPPPLTEQAAERLAAGHYPRYATVVAVGTAIADWAAAQDFEVGLAVVLDGIGVAVERGRMPGMSLVDPCP